MTYLVLARKWRPQNFSDLLGQEGVVQTLTNALSAGTFGQAYLFSGLRGVGKTTVARLLAKSVNCEQGPTAEPCGQCASCREITEGSSIDVIEIDGASNRGIDDVRDLRELLQFHPTRDRYRVLIVDEVHMLTREAFNALLKSLEEPPPYILWVFATTERTKVPETILSRCQQLEFRPVGTDRIRDHLQRIAGDEAFELAPSAAAAIAGVAEGSVRDALSLLDQLRAFAADSIDDDAVAAVIGVPPFEVTASLVAALAEGRVAEALEMLREQLARGRDATVLHKEIGRALRTCLHLAVDRGLEPDLAEGHRALLEPVTEVGADGLGRMLGLWLDHGLAMRDASNRELALEVVALRLARWPSVRAVEQWLADGCQSLPAAGSGGGSTPSSPTAEGSGPAEGSGGGVGGPQGTGPSAAAEPTSASTPSRSAEQTKRREHEQWLAEVNSDPGVVLARKVLGGEVVAACPDREDA
jgi:DNA polymerase-3 subunit gamma/tau